MNYAKLKLKWQGKNYMESKSLGAQCVAWAKRGAKDLYGISINSFGGSAINGWETGSPFDKNWKRIFNSAVAIPKVGSVVFFAKTVNNPYGHVAITGDGSTSTKLVVLEQNAGNGNGDGKGKNAITERVLDYVHPAKCLGWFEYNLQK